MNLKIHNITQQSDEWFALHDLRLTSSKATAIGNNGKGLDTLTDEIVSQHFSASEKKHFGNIHTDRGNELEEVARAMYELETGNKVEQVGFVETGEYTGCSPDGMVGEEGITEFKCPDDLKYCKILLYGEKEIDSGYLWQVQYQLLLTGRKWADLVNYNPNYPRNLIIFRILPDAQKQEALREGIETGARLIKEKLALFEERFKETGHKIIGGPIEEKDVKVFELGKKVEGFKVPKSPSPQRKRVKDNK